MDERLAELEARIEDLEAWKAKFLNVSTVGPFTTEGLVVTAYGSVGPVIPGGSELHVQA